MKNSTNNPQVKQKNLKNIGGDKSQTEKYSSIKTLDNELETWAPIKTAL